MVSAQASSLTSVTLALVAIPALWTGIGGGPSSPATRWTMASTSGRSRTSQGSASARRPRPVISEATSSSCACVRAETATSAPEPARAIAMARPMPRPPPVTRATRPASSGGTDDSREQLEVDVAARDDADHLLPRGTPRQGHGQGHRAGSFRDHPVSLRQQPDRLARLLQAGHERPVEQVLGQGEHVREYRFAPDTVDEGRLVWHRLDRAGAQRSLQRRPRLGLDRVDHDPRLEPLDRGRDSAGEPAAAPGDQHGVDVFEVFHDLQADDAVAGHDPVVVEGMDEGAWDAGIAAVAEGLPPA